MNTHYVTYMSYFKRQSLTNEQADNDARERVGGAGSARHGLPSPEHTSMQMKNILLIFALLSTTGALRLPGRSAG